MMKKLVGKVSVGNESPHQRRRHDFRYFYVIPALLIYLGDILIDLIFQDP
jgi:hypothetical protein